MGHTFANGDNDRQHWSGGSSESDDDDDDTEPTKRHKYCAIILIDNKIVSGGGACIVFGVGLLKAKIKWYLRVKGKRQIRQPPATNGHQHATKRCDQIEIPTNREKLMHCYMAYQSYHGEETIGIVRL